MTPTAPAIPRSPWPIAIVGFFALFISGIVIFSAWAIRQNMDLVRKDYYQEEIGFQKQIDAVDRTKSFVRDVGADYDSVRNQLLVRLPIAHLQSSTAGTIHLYRPSDAKLDQHLPLKLSPDGTQPVDASKLLAGLWKVRVQWKVNGDEFYFDRPVVVTGTTH